MLRVLLTAAVVGVCAIALVTAAPAARAPREGGLPSPASSPPRVGIVPAPAPACRDDPIPVLTAAARALAPRPPTTRRVAGRLLDARTGGPLRQSVRFWFEGPGSGTRREFPWGNLVVERPYHSDEDGTFDIPDAPAGVTHITFPVRETKMCGNDMSDHRDGRNRFELPQSPDDAVDLVLELETGRRKEGVVRDDRGVPLPGARVSCSNGAVTTDLAGRFELVNAVEVGYRRAWGERYTVSAPGFADRTLYVRSDEPSDKTLEVSLGRSGRLVVRVTDESGAPAPGAVLEVVPATTIEDLSEDDLLLGTSRTADDDGRLVVDLLPGVWSVSTASPRSLREVDVRVGREAVVDIVEFDEPSDARWFVPDDDG